MVPVQVNHKFYQSEGMEDSAHVTHKPRKANVNQFRKWRWGARAFLEWITMQTIRHDCPSSGENPIFADQGLRLRFDPKYSAIILSSSAIISASYQFPRWTRRSIKLKPAKQFFRPLFRNNCKQMGTYTVSNHYPQKKDPKSREIQ